MKIDAIGSVQTIDDIGSKLNPVDSSSAWEEAANSSISPDDDFSTKASQKRADRSVEQIRNEFSKIQSERNEWRNQAAKMNVVQAAKSVPDDEAKITELAKQFDAPVEMVRNYRSLFESRAQELRLSELPKTNPKTADFLSDPNNARIAHDDIDNIMELESLVTNPDGFTIAGDFGEREAGARLAPIDFAVDSVRSLVAGAVGGVVKASGSVSSYLARSLPILGTNAEADLYNPVALTGDEQAARYREAEETGNKIASESGADALYRTGKKWEDAIAGDDIKEYGFASKALLSGMKSLGNMGPAVLASIITKNPSFALTFAGVSEGGESFMEDVLKGKRFAQATAHGIINGGIEVGTEYIPMVRLIKDAAVGTPFIKMFLRNWATETPTEMVATAGQTLTDNIADKKDDQNMGDVFLKWLSELPANELETAIAVIPMSLGFSGAARISQIRASEATEKGIKGLNDSAAQSKLRGRAADVYKTLVGSMTKGTPITHAYIDSEKWTTYFQEQGVDPKAEAEKYGVTNYEEAIGTGSFITIPFDEYQSNFSGSEHAPSFTADTKLSEKGMTARERQEYFQREDERAKEMDGFLSELGKESENARSVNDVLSELTDEIAIQLESGMDKKTAKTQATIAARAFMHPVMRDVVERAKEKGQELTPDEVAGEIRNRFTGYGLTINANATPNTLNSRKNIDPAIDSQLEKLRRGEQPKEKDVYGQSLMEYIRKKGGLRPDDIIHDLVKNKQLPRSIINEKGMGADEFASLQDVLDFGLDTEQAQGDNALIDALVDEYTTGEKRYSSAQLNSELLSEAQALNELEKDLQSAGIDINAIDDNAVIREVLSRHYEEQNGKDTRKEPQTSEADRYEQRGFTESDTPTAEERAEANRQYDEVEKKYKDTPLWMKAPNGEPTKLNERQWVQVRTPNFKNWFGDWEKAGIKERLEGQEPVAVEPAYNLGTPAERRVAAKALGINETVNTPIGQIAIDAKSIKSTLQHGNTNAKLDVLKNIRKITEASIYLDQANDFDGKEHKNFYLATKIKRGGSSELVFLRVVKRNGREERLHIQAVFTEEEIKNQVPVSALDETRQGEARNNSGGYPRGPNLYKSILQDIYSVDNDSVSKVVDSNGEPQVVYHLTDGDFNVFDVSKARQNMDIPAFFFSSGTEDWADMGGRTIGAFLDMKHPKQGKPMANGEGAKVRDELVDAGYDGTIETEEEMETEYAVFDPNQIKSATGNIGTFSDNPNILYQFIGEQGAASLDKAQEASIRLDNLTVAREMETFGKDAKVIKLATGWERGADGKWRYEIPDGQAGFGGGINARLKMYKDERERSLDDESLSEEQSDRIFDEMTRRIKAIEKDGITYKLEDIYSNDDLYDAYPDLKNIDVTVKTETEGPLGRTDVSAILLKNRDETSMFRTLLHEIQHVIQEIEGFGKGANPSAFKKDFIEKIRSPREKAAIDISILWEKVQNSPEYKKAEAIKKRFEKAETDEDWGAIEKEYPGIIDPDDLYRESPAYKALKKARDEYEKNFGDDPSIWLDADRANAEMGKYTFDQYKKLTGETEARNVQSRLSMTQEQRRQTLAKETEDVAREDQIFLYQADGTPVVTLTGNELGDGADVFEAARNWYKQNLQGTTINRPEIGDIRFTGKGWGKVKSGVKSDELKAKIIPSIKDVISKGEYHGRSELSKDRKDAIVAFHYFTANVTVGNEVVPVGVNVGEDEYGNLFYNINHHPDELVKKKAPILPGEYARGSEPLDTASDVLEQSIGQNSDGVNLFILNEKAGKGVTRGATVINPDRTMRIELFKDANYSTFVHETAHFMLEVYSDMAADANASAYIKGEYATIREYIGAEEEKPITREQHEKFARSFEAYLMEGKAPSPELQGIFSRFKTWLINIYKTLSGLNVKLNKDIREVFDRMMASDEEIAIMHEASELQPLFTTAEMMGIAQDEFDAYRKIADSELTKAQDQFRQKAMKTKLREKTKGYKEELEQEKKRVEKEYDRDPVVTAFNDLTSDEGFSLNETELQRVYGKAFMSKLPKRNGKRIYSKDGQVSLEDLAENLNFNSGDALIQAIAQLPNRSEYINDKAIANLRDRESDVLNSDTVADEAESALHNEYMEERQRKELTILNRLKRAGKAAKISENKDRIKHRKEAKQIEEDVAAQMDAMKVVSESIIAEKKVKDVKPYLYLRAMQAASRRARKSLKKTNPDYTAAARQKQAEIMNGLLYKEAIRVRQEINKRTLQAKAIARKPLKDALKTRDSLEINKAKYIAALIGIGRKPEVFLERIKTEEKNAGSSDHFDYQVKSTLNELDTATALDVIEDIRAHWDQARRDKVMLVDGKKVEIDEAAEEIADTLSEFGKTGRDKSRDDSASKSLLKAIGNLALYHTRMESFCDMVDGKRVGDGIGPFMRYIFNPVKQAADKARFEQSEYTKKLTEIIDGFGFSRETIEAPELGYTFGKDTGYGKAELIHAILHTGNRSNRERLIVGRKWGSIMNNQLDTRKWNAFMSRMISEGRITEQDFDGVQKIWDLFDKLKPKSQASHKEVFGRYFDEIKASPFFEFGKRYDGGYIPAIYDSKESVAGERQLDPVRDLINEMGAALPKPTAGWGNSRIEGLAHPLLFNMSALRTHINKQILFAYLAPVNKDVSKLLNKKIVRSALKAYDPEFFGKVIEPWLSRAITQNLEASGKKPEPYDSYARTLRTRAGVSIMFANVTNAVEQVFDMTAAFSKVKSHYLTGAFKTMVSDRTATVKAVMDSSPYMRGRMSAEIMAANGRFEQALRPGKLKKLDSWLTDNAYFLQSSVDNFCGPLTWTATYNQATESGLPHNEAVAQADSVVRQVFGANAAEDVSNFEGGTPLKRMFTQFSGYFVQRANLVAGEYSKIQRSDIANKKAAAAILLLQTVLLPAWIGAALRKIVAGSDDDETFASWLMDVFGWGTFNYGLSMGGWAGQAANVAIDYHRGKSFSSGRIFYPPAIKLVEDFFKAFKIFPDTWNGDIDAPKFMKYLSGFENFVPGVPVIPARPVASMKYGYDVMTDKVEPTSGYDFVRGAVTGRASADSRR